jgi:hypothetical protein
MSENTTRGRNEQICTSMVTSPTFFLLQFTWSLQGP